MSTYRASKDDRRLGALDALRFVAALGVLAFHFTALISPAWDGTIPPEQFHDVHRLTAYGTLGVPLFFVISGFVLLMSAWGKTVPEFVASRLGRLYPAYWAAAGASVILVLFVWPDNYVFKGITGPQALLNMTMFQGAFGARNLDGVYWTLWYEARFYLLIVALLLIGITRGRVLAFAALWPIVGAIASQGGATLVTTFLMPDFAPFFAGGMLLFLIFRDGHDLGTWLLVAFQVVVGVHQVVPIYLRSITVDASTHTTALRLTVCLVGCFALVAVVTLTRAARWSFRWMTVAGALTYPVYLVHENFGWFVISRSEHRLGPWGSVAAATAFVLLAATALHYLVEKPLGPRLRKAALRMLAPVATAAAARPDITSALLETRRLRATGTEPHLEGVPGPRRRPLVPTPEVSGDPRAEQDVRVLV